MKPLHLAKRLLGKIVLDGTGLRRKIADGRLILSPVAVLNFVFQRIFRVNASCKWAVHYTSQVITPEKIVIGQRSGYCFATAGGCYIQAKNGIILGDHVMFAPGVKIVSADHDFEDPSWNGHTQEESIRIGNRCLIGANAVILPGVCLGNNVVVGAGAVVTKSFPGNVIIGGNPAKVIRELPTRLP